MTIVVEQNVKVASSNQTTDLILLANLKIAKTHSKILRESGSAVLNVNSP